MPVFNSYSETTLRFFPERCIGCERCTEVCPHGVFSIHGKKASLRRPERCMECGACEKNCPVSAIAVESGVGCAHAMIYSALTGRKEVTCGGDTCCGGEGEPMEACGCSGHNQAGEYHK